MAKRLQRLRRFPVTEVKALPLPPCITDYTNANAKRFTAQVQQAPPLCKEKPAEPTVALRLRASFTLEEILYKDRTQEDIVAYSTPRTLPACYKCYGALANKWDEDGCKRCSCLFWDRCY
jgi:hypothetical protein